MSSSYGGFYGGDPRKFTPDEECCTVAEIAAWKDACAAWDQGLRPEVDGHIRVYDAAGKLILHIARNPFGIGVTVIDDGEDDGWDDEDGPDDGDDPDDVGPDAPEDALDDEPAPEADPLTTVSAGWMTANLDEVPA